MPLQDSIVNAADTVARAVQTPITAPIPKEESLSFLELLGKGGLVMIPLGICFVIAVFIIIERLLVISRANKLQAGFMNNIREAVQSGNLDSARMVARNTNTPAGRMIEKGINRIGRPLNDIEKSIESTGKLEVQALEKNVNILGIIAGIAPMMGFIGTIVGVILIFYKISIAGKIEVAAVADGLYMKMITSAAGLVVGIIAYTGYHALSTMVDRAVNKMERAAIDFIDLLQEPTK